MSYQPNSVKRFFRMLKPDKRDILYLYVYAIFNGLINLVLPIGIQAVIGIIMSGQIVTSWFVLVVGITIAIAVAGALQVVQLTITEVLQRRIFARSSFEFAYRIPKFKPESILQGKHYPPELVNRFFDTLAVQKGTPKILTDFSASAVQVLFGLILLAFYHPFFVFLGLTLVMLLVVIYMLTGRKGLETSLKESKYKYAVAYWLEEVARTMATFKLAGNTELPLRKTDKLVYNYLKARGKHFAVIRTQYIYAVIFKTLITGGLLILGSLLVVSHEINIGQFVASEIVILIIFNSVEKLILTMETVYDVMTAVEKIGAVTDLPLENTEGLLFSELDTGKGISVCFDNVTYQFPQSNKPSICHLSAEIEAGEMICISGAGGSGKSVLLELICGLYESYEGAITLNNLTIKALNMTDWRSYISDSLAREQLFLGTVEDNLTLGKPDVKISKILEVIQTVGLKDFIQSLPKGFASVIEPEGRTFSTHIIIKLMLARSMCQNPRLMVLEDFMPLLERDEQQRITDFLTTRDNKRTLIAISNNAYFASKCDRVMFLEKGHIRAFAPFKEVLKVNGAASVFQN